MGAVTQTFGANTAITLDLSSLATSTTFLAGVESTEVDNSATGFMDVMITCDGILGHASTAPAIGQLIAVYAWGSDVSLATTPIDTLDGTSSAETLAHAAVLNSLRLIASPSVTVATAGLKYYFQPTGLAQFFGGVLPKFWGLYVAHNHTGALAATQSGLFSYHGTNFATT